MKESQLENKTEIATNDYVRMVDENNNSVKIKKDSFMAAIRDALPSIISDGATGGGSVLSIINGALKTRTDANLASVLGGGRIIFKNKIMSQGETYQTSNVAGGLYVLTENMGGNSIVFTVNASTTYIIHNTLPQYFTVTGTTTAGISVTNNASSRSFTLREI